MTYENPDDSVDSQTHVYFYERNFYVLSNFSSFTVRYNSIIFPTNEHLYHWFKFCEGPTQEHLDVCEWIRTAPSAHEAFQIAQRNRHLYDPQWETKKFPRMKEGLWLKSLQHEYVRRKLLQTGDRILVENSWRDNVWGEGPNKDGQNRLGKMWMEIRTEMNEFQMLYNCLTSGQMNAHQWVRHCSDTPWLKEWAEVVHG